MTGLNEDVNGRAAPSNALRQRASLSSNTYYRCLLFVYRLLLYFTRFSGKQALPKQRLRGCMHSEFSFVALTLLLRA